MKDKEEDPPQDRDEQAEALLRFVDELDETWDWEKLKAQKVKSEKDRQARLE